MFNAWSLNFARTYVPYLDMPSLLKLRTALIRERHGAMGYEEAIEVQLRWPARCRLSFRPSSNDIYTFREILIERVYQELADRVRSADTIIDLGANIGLASMYLASRYPQARLFCLEPDAENYALLRKNTAYLEAQNRCRTLQAAAWREHAAVALSAPIAGHVNQYRAEAASVARPGQQQITGMSMREILECSGFERVDLLKIDIEGAETELFQGPTDWIERVQNLAIEFHEDSRERSGFDALMQRHGFRLHGGDAHTVVATRG
jgi:FkbM family methyltransferase